MHVAETVLNPEKASSSVNKVGSLTREDERLRQRMSDALSREARYASLAYDGKPLHWASRLERCQRFKHRRH